MELEFVNQFEKIVSLKSETPITKFWNLAADTYLIKQRYQDYTMHFKTIKNRLLGQQDQIVLNLAAGKIVGKGKIVDFLKSLNTSNSIYLINIDISKKLISYNNKKLEHQGFNWKTRNGIVWLSKDNLFIRNILGDISNLLFDAKITLEAYRTVIPRNTHLFCFDGFSNLCLDENKLEKIFEFCKLFSYNYTTWLFPGNDFSYFLEKIRFYQYVVKAKQKLPLNYYQLRLFEFNGKSLEEMREFSKKSVERITKNVKKWKQKLGAIQLRFLDDKINPSLKFCAFYGKRKYMKKIVAAKELKVLDNPLFRIKKAKNNNSFIKTYPLIFEC